MMCQARHKTCTKLNKSLKNM